MLIQKERGGEQSPPAFDFSKVKVMICVPSRGVCPISFTVDLVKTTAKLYQLGADFALKHGRSDCLPDHSRNQFIGDFLASDCTHLWMVDDDMGWNIDAIPIMLAKDKEFIAGAGPKKQDPPEFAVRNWTNAHVAPGGDRRPYVENGLIRCSEIGGAFLLLKRSVAEKMAKHYPHLRCTQVHPEHGYSFFQTRYETHDYRGEDYLFCHRWTDIGGEIWCYPDIDFQHVGVRVFTGNYHEYLLAQPKPQKTTPEPPPHPEMDSLIQRMRAMTAAAPQRIQEVLR